MKKLICLLAAGALSLPVTAVNAATPDDSSKRICKSRQRTGTRFVTRICLTKADWDLLAESTKRQAAETFNRSGRPTDERDRQGYTYGG